MALVNWTTETVEKTMTTTRTKGEDGKYHVKRDKVQEVPYTFPQINALACNDIGQLAQALSEILSQGQAGFTTVRTLIDHINFGLNQNAKMAVRRGADVRYTAEQRNTIKAVGGLFKADVLSREIAVASLLRQGITDAEAALDAFVAESSPEASNGVTA